MNNVMSCAILRYGEMLCGNAVYCAHAFFLRLCFDFGFVGGGEIVPSKTSFT
jgi:hypothetical protein